MKILPTVPGAPFGRAEEMKKLNKLIGETVDGEKRAFAITGPAGIGKSTMLRWALGRCADEKFASAAIRAPRSAGLPARYPIGELLGGVIDSLQENRHVAPDSLHRVVDTLQRRTTVEDYPAALPQIADALEQAAKRAPIALFLDDYQWAPEDGRADLIAAVRVIEAPVLLALASRSSEEVPAVLPESSADLWIHELELGRLGIEDLHLLAEQRLGAPALDELVDFISRQTLGNPLFAVEALRALAEDKMLATVGGHRTLRSDQSPPKLRSLDDLIRARIGNLSESGLRAINTLAIVGRSASFDELRAITEESNDALVVTLSELDEAALVDLEGAPPAYSIAHPRYVEFLTERTTATQRAALHQAILRALEERGTASATERAHHALRALEQPPNFRTLVEHAAEEAEEAGSVKEAAAWYGHLARLITDPQAQAVVLEKQARACLNVDPQMAVDLFTRAMPAAPSPQFEAKLLLGRAEAHRILGNFDTAQDDLTAAVPISDPEDLPQVRHLSAVLRVLKGDIDGFERDLAQHLEEFPSSKVTPMVKGHIALVNLLQGRLRTSIPLFEEAIVDAQGTRFELIIRMNHAWALACHGKWPQAFPQLEAVATEAQRIGDAWNLTTALGNLVRLLGWRGDFAAAFNTASKASRVADRIPNPMYQADWVTALCLALLEAGRLEEGRQRSEPILGALEQAEPQEQASHFAFIAEIFAKTGDPSRAQQILDLGKERLYEAKHWEISILRVQAELTDLQGQPRLAYDQCIERLSRPSDLAYEYARLVEQASLLAERLRLRSEAIDHTERALELYRALGSRHRIAAMEGRRLFLTPPRIGRPRSQLPMGLTSREMEVLRLAALDRTNREIAMELFLSVGTVRKHMENLMGKTAVSRRSQLRFVLQRVEEEILKSRSSSDPTQI